MYLMILLIMHIFLYQFICKHVTLLSDPDSEGQSNWKIKIMKGFSRVLFFSKINQIKHGIVSFKTKEC